MVAASVELLGLPRSVKTAVLKSTVPLITRLLNVLVPEPAVTLPVKSPVVFPVIFPVTFPVTFPVIFPAKLVEAVIKVPVIAAAVEAPMTMLLTEPPVNTAFEEASCELAVTVPVAVIAPVDIEVGLIPNSKILLLPSLPNNLLSVTFCAIS